MTREQLAAAARDLLQALERSGHVVVRPGAFALAAERIAALVANARAALPAPRPAIPDLTPRFDPPLESLTDLPTATGPRLHRASAVPDADEPSTKPARPSRLLPKP